MARLTDHLKFRIYIETRDPKINRRRYFYEVWVFATDELMYEFYEAKWRMAVKDYPGARQDDEPGPRDWAARCQQASRRCNKTGRPDYGYLGEMFFYAGRVSANVVTHECTHAVLYWAERHGINPKKIYESSSDVTHPCELIPYALGYMVSQFYRHWYAKKRRLGH